MLCLGKSIGTFPYSKQWRQENKFISCTYNFYFRNRLWITQELRRIVPDENAMCRMFCVIAKILKFSNSTDANNRVLNNLKHVFKRSFLCSNFVQIQLRALKCGKL